MNNKELEEAIKDIQFDLDIRGTCEECGGFFLKSSLQKVVLELSFYTKRIQYFCINHKKPYDREFREMGHVSYFKDSVPVDESGKFIK